MPLLEAARTNRPWIVQLYSSGNRREPDLQWSDIYLALMCGLWESCKPQDKILKLKTLKYSYLHMPIWTLQPMDSTLPLAGPSEKQVLTHGAHVALYSRNIKIGRSTNRRTRWCESGSLYSPHCRKWLWPFDGGWGGLGQFIWLANGTTTLGPRYALIMHPQHILSRFKTSFLTMSVFSWINVSF